MIITKKKTLGPQLMRFLFLSYLCVEEQLFWFIHYLDLKIGEVSVSVLKLVLGYSSL